MGYSLKRLIELIDKYEYISFDIFDTLIKRNVLKPTDLFKIVEIEYRKRFDEKLPIDFCKARIESEQNIWKQSKGNDLTFIDIYMSIPDLSNKQKKRLMNIELEMELKYCQLNSDIYPVYKHCIDSNKRVFLISDMYLGVQEIEKILEKCNIFKYTRLYVSSAYKKTKASGELFEIVLMEEKISSKDVLHIGDNLRGDFIVPKLKGIHSFKIDNFINHLTYTKIDEETTNINESIMYSVMNNKIKSIENVYEKVGFELLGPLLLGFSYWLKEKLKEHNYTEVFFLSRDGYIMKQVFDILFPNEFQTFYFCVSRKSLSVPLLCNITKISDLTNFIKFRKVETLQNILKRVGVKKIFDVDKPLRNKKVFREEILNDNQIISSILKKYIPEINENAKKQKNYFLSYANSLVTKQNIAIVDLGWHGSIQESLTILLDDIKIKGFYIALCEGNSENKFNYLFNNNKKNIFNPNLISSFRGLIETFFSANHGSVDGYNQKNKSFFPIFDEEKTDVKTVEIIGKIHEGAIRYINDVIPLIYKCDIDRNRIYQPLNQLLTKPTKNDIKLFKDIKFNDTSTRNLISDKNILFYFFHFKYFFSDFVDCDWRIGFLKRLFKIGNQYDNLMNLINGKVKKGD